MTIAQARKQFARGLSGTWSHDDLLVGMSLSFREDGSGNMEEWGWDHLQHDPQYVSVPDFQWRTVSDRTIEITHRGVRSIVPYDFALRKNQYDIEELQVFQTDLTVDESGEKGFWLSPYSLVYRGPEKPTSGFWERLQKKFRQ